jgi:alcohol dehydrogenase class IV
MSDLYRFIMSTEIVYGIGASREVGSIAASLGAKKAFIVSDQGVKQAGLLEPVQKGILEKGIETAVFDNIERSSSVQTVDRGADIIRSNGFDIIVAIGGGSAIDSGKAMGVVVTNGGACGDYAGINKIKHPPIPVIALPTTAGTSAELTDVAVIADRTKKARLGIRSPLIVPKIAILDSLLTVSMPAHVTAATGMDALTHAIESYTNIVTKEPTETMALEAIKLIGSNLRTAVANGNNTQAREGMMMACLLTGLAFRNTRLGAVHAITGPFCGYYEIEHGIANAVILPYVMKFNLSGCMEKYANIAAALGLNTDNMSKRQAALSAIDAVQELHADVGLPASFKDLKLDGNVLPQIVEEAAKSGNLAINPRQATKGDLLVILKQVLLAGL